MKKRRKGYCVFNTNPRLALGRIELDKQLSEPKSDLLTNSLGFLNLSRPLHGNPVTDYSFYIYIYISKLGRKTIISHFSGSYVS